MSDKKKFPKKLESPPNNSEVLTTACQYCVVGCGYEAHIWDEANGSPDAPELTKANWVSPAMTGKVKFNGAPKIAAVVPDPKCSMNRGNHSVRGGTQGRDLVFSETNPADERDSTKERITTPYIRTKNGYEAIKTETALEILTALVKEATGHQLDGTFTNPNGLGVKLYEYQYLENTFAATSLFFQLIGTPNVAFHDRPSVTSNTIGFEDSGIDPHGYAYEDIWDSDVLFLVGNNPYEAHSVFFMNYMTGKRIIVLDPRRTITADYAVKTNGLHLQPKVLGADTLVLNALARYIRDQQIAKPDEWRNLMPTDLIITDEDLQKIKQEAADPKFANSPEKRRRARYQLSLNKYFEFLDETDADGKLLYSLENASEISGISLENLKKCAEMLAGPVDGMTVAKDRKVSLIFEKGLIWGYNYQNTAAMANLGLLLGSVLRPNQNLGEIKGVTGRAGGHQKGWAEVRYRLDPSEPKPNNGYPFHNATDEFIADDGSGDRFRVNHYFDAHLVGTKVAPPHKRTKIKSDTPDINLFWIIGCNPVGQIGNAEAKWKEIKRRQGEELPENIDEAKDVLCRKIKEGKLVIVQQDIYPNPTTKYADLILPAAGWGEHDFTRYTGERRLRLYSKFQDPPLHRENGQLKNDSHCLADWEIFRDVMLKLLPNDTIVNELEKSKINEWRTSADVFKAMALNSNRTSLFGELESKNDPPRGHKILGDRKTEGFILPIKADPNNAGKFLESPRVFPKLLGFPGNQSAYYAFVRSDWKEIKEDFEANLPQTEDEFVICNGRVNELWNSMFTNIRNETIRQRYPDDMPGTILEFNADDAANLGVRNGDVVEVSCNQIHLGANAASFKGIVSVQEGGKTPFVPSGMVFAIFSYPAMNARLNEFPYRDFHAKGYANNITTGYVDPINPIAAVKYARGKIVKTGARYEIGTYLGPSYAPRNRAFTETMVDIETEAKRLEWKMRELIVQRGLPRFRLHKKKAGATVANLLLNPDLFIPKIHTDVAFRTRFRGSVELVLEEEDGTMQAPELNDKWTASEQKLALDWLKSIEQT